MRLLHEDATPRELRAFRMLVFGVWFLRVAFKPLPGLAVVPASVDEPVGLLRLLPASVEPLLRNAVFLHGLKAATLIAITLVIVGVALRPASVAACVLTTLFTSLWRGFAGHIDHESVLILYAGYLLTLFSFADAWAARKGEERAPGAPSLAGIPLTTTLAVLCLVYTMVGTFRLVHGTPDVFTSGSLTFWALRNAYETVDPAWGFGKLVIEHAWLGQMLKAGFPLITLFEITAFFALFSRWYRYAFLVVMVPFHLLSWFVLDVFFWENMVLYVLFFDLTRRAQEEWSPVPSAPRPGP